MKLSILFLFVLIVNFSFSQDVKNSFHNKIFDAEKENNHHLVSSDLLNNLEEIKSLIFNIKSNNSEGKFPVFKSNNKEITTVLNTKEIKNETKINHIIEVNSNLKEASLTMINYISFINEIIAQNLESKETLEFVVSNDKVITDEIDFYRNLSILINGVKYEVNTQIDVSVGNNIYKYLNKLHKTALDKTLESSLNLVAVNF